MSCDVASTSIERFSRFSTAFPLLLTVQALRASPALPQWSAAMQPGKIIADIFAFLLLATLLCGIFLLFGRPLWPVREAKMVILLPHDPNITGSLTGNCLKPCLPHQFDLRLAPPRPEEGPVARNQFAGRAVE